MEVDKDDPRDSWLGAGESNHGMLWAVKDLKDHLVPPHSFIAVLIYVYYLITHIKMLFLSPNHCILRCNRLSLKHSLVFSVIITNRS